MKYGDHFTRVKRRKVLKPNIEYTTPVGYTYKTNLSFNRDPSIVLNGTLPALAKAS